MDIAKTGNLKKIEEFEKAAAKFNALQHKGYFAAKPYFNVLRMANVQAYFVFGFNGDLQDIHRENYPGTVRNLRRLKNEETKKYPDMHWGHFIPTWSVILNELKFLAFCFAILHYRRAH